MSELSPETRAWIDAVGAGDAPTPEDRARIRQKLALELGAAAFATTAVVVATQATAVAGTGASMSTAASSLGSLSMGKAVGASLLTKLAVAAAVAGAVSTSAFVAVQDSKVAPMVVSANTTAKRSAPRAAMPTHAVVAEPSPIVEQLEPSAAIREVVAPAAPKRAVAPRVAAQAQAPSAARGSSIADELPLLQEAQTALREGRIEDALARTSAHAERFPTGALREERAAVEMLARCAQGSASATSLEGFLSTAPESPLKARVRAACKVER